MNDCRTVQIETNNLGKYSSRCEIVCISTNVVLSNSYKQVYKEFTFAVPYLDLEDCSTIDCTAITGTERILFQEFKFLAQPCIYNCYVVIAQEYAFTIHCRSGDKKFTRELVFPVLCTMSIPGQGPFALKTKLIPSFCRSFIIKGESYIRRYTGQQPGEQFAYAVAFDNSLSSIYAGSSSADFNFYQDAGKVTAVSHPTGEMLFHKFGTATEDELGFSLDAGYDLDGDGWKDILVGAPGATIGSAIRAGYIRVLSGFDGSTLLEIYNTEGESQFGWSVSWGGDLDGDGTPDILVGAPQASPGGKTNAGSAFVYSGASGSLLYRLDGPNAGDSFGYAVKMIGDVDGDGIPDFAVGAPFASPAGLQQAGVVYVYSGASGSLIYSIEGMEINAGLGFSLGSLGDINGDGIPEILVGAPDSSPGGREEAGSAYVFSGLDGSQLLHFAGPVRGEEVGISVSTTGDIDGDGLPDLVLGAPSASPHNKTFAGKVYLVSSRSGNVIYVLEGAVPWAQFGWSVAGAGQPNSNTIFVGSPGIDTLTAYQILPMNIYCEINATALVSVIKKADILIPALPCNQLVYG